MYRTARRAALSGINIPRVPRGGWHREDPTDNGEGGAPGHNNGGGDTAKAGADGTSEKTPKIEGEFDKERHERALAAARDGETKAKAAKKAADDRLAAVLKAAGLTTDGKTDPETQLADLRTRAENAEQRATQLATRDAVRTAAGKHSADAELLLDSNAFLGKLADLDTTANDFGDKVADLVKAAVKENARYASSSSSKGAGKQGTDHSGAGNGKAGKPKNLTEAIAARLGG
jgi:hypothetical protein